MSRPTEPGQSPPGAEAAMIATLRHIWQRGLDDWLRESRAAQRLNAPHAPTIESAARMILDNAPYMEVRAACEPPLLALAEAAAGIRKVEPDLPLHICAALAAALARRDELAEHSAATVEAIDRATAATEEARAASLAEAEAAAAAAEAFADLEDLARAQIEIEVMETRATAT